MVDRESYERVRPIYIYLRSRAEADDEAKDAADTRPPPAGPAR